MTPEERISQLETEVRELRAVLATQAAALADAMAERRKTAESKDLLESRRASDRERQRQRRILRTLAREQSSREVHGTSRDCHVTTPAPSSSPFPSSFPPSSTPPSPYPLSFPPSSPPPPPASQGPQPAPPPNDFALTPPAAGKKPRKASEAEGWYRRFQESRQARCDEVGETFVDDRWPAERQNKVIGAILREPAAARSLLDAAWGLYLADDGERVRAPAWSLGYFLSGGVRAKYETKANREGVAA